MKILDKKKSSNIKMKSMKSMEILPSLIISNANASMNKNISPKNQLFYNQAKAFSNLYLKVQAKNKDHDHFDKSFLHACVEPYHLSDTSIYDLTPNSSKMMRSINFQQHDRRESKMDCNVEDIPILQSKTSLEIRKDDQKFFNNPPIFKKSLAVNQILINDNNKYLSINKQRSSSLNLLYSQMLKSLIDESSIDERNSYIESNKQLLIKSKKPITSSNHMPINGSTGEVETPRHVMKPIDSPKKFRRKSCYCQLCGGISHIEIKVMHLPNYFKKHLNKYSTNGTKSDSKPKLAINSIKASKSDFYAFAKAFSIVSRTKTIKGNFNRSTKSKISNDNQFLQEPQRIEGLASSPSKSNSDLMTASNFNMNDNLLNQNPLYNTNSNLFFPALNLPPIQINTSISLTCTETPENDLNQCRNNQILSPRENISNDSLAEKINTQKAIKYIKLGDQLELNMREEAANECSPIKNINCNIVKGEMNIAKSPKHKNMYNLQPISILNNAKKPFDSLTLINTKYNRTNSSHKLSLQTYIHNLEQNENQRVKNNNKSPLDNNKFQEDLNLIMINKGIQKNSSKYSSPKALKNPVKSTKITKKLKYGKKTYLKHILSPDVKPYYDKSLAKLAVNASESPTLLYRASPNLAKTYRGSKFRFKNSIVENSLPYKTSPTLMTEIDIAISPKGAKSNLILNIENLKERNHMTTLKNKEPIVDLNSCDTLNGRDMSSSNDVLIKNRNKAINLDKSPEHFSLESNGLTSPSNKFQIKKSKKSHLNINIREENSNKSLRTK